MFQNSGVATSGGLENRQAHLSPTFFEPKKSQFQQQFETDDDAQLSPSQSSDEDDQRTTTAKDQPCLIEDNSEDSDEIYKKYDRI